MLLTKPLESLFSRFGNQDKFYRRRYFKLGMAVGVSFYMLAFGFFFRMVLELHEDWHYIDLMPLHALFSGGLWGIAGALLTYAGDVGFIYAWLNHAHRKGRRKERKARGEKSKNSVA